MLSCSQDSWNNVLLSVKSTACVTQGQLQLSTIRSRDCDQPVPKSECSTKTKQKGKHRLKIRKEKKRMSKWAKAEGERHPSYKLAKWRAPKADKEASCKQAKLYACVLAMCTQWWPTGCLGGVDCTPLYLNQAWQTTNGCRRRNGRKGLCLVFEKTFIYSSSSSKPSKATLLFESRRMLRVSFSNSSRCSGSSIEARGGRWLGGFDNWFFA